MGRPGITYEMVEAAADSLLAEQPGQIPTPAAVRARLGTGSPNTVYRHMRTWSENRPRPAVQAVVIPEEIARVLSSWVTQASTGARADAEERALLAQAAADDLLRAGEGLEAERDELQGELATVTTQRDQAQATADERAGEIQRLLDDVTRERALAGVAQVDAAQARHRADSQVEQLAELKARVAELAAAVDAERQARTVAERDLAVSAARLASAAAERDVLRDQVVEVQQELVLSRDRTEEVRAELEKRLAVERDAVTQARAAAAAAAVEVAQLQERLANAVQRNPV